MSRGVGKRHSPSQIVEKLRDCDAMLNAGKTVSEVVQHLGISEQTYYRWRNQYGGMKVIEAFGNKSLAETQIHASRFYVRHWWGVLSLSILSGLLLSWPRKRGESVKTAFSQK